MSTLNVDKVDPSTGTALEIGTSGDTITVPSGATFVVAGTTEITGASNVQRPNAQPIFYNGEMTVSQRGDSTGITNANSGYYGPDRYKFNEDGTMTAVLSITQETLTSGNAWADGFDRALKYDVTTADASVAADIYARIEQRFEKGDLSLFKKGTSGAETYTLAFWVKATVTGTNVVELQDQVNTRHCCASYTVSSTDTWEHKVLNFAADTSGPLGVGNGLGMNINFALQAGTNYTSGTLATAWAASTDANRAVGQVNNFSSTSNNFHITGVQLEVGTYTSSTLPPFQHESYGDNLQRCQRYYEISDEFESWVFSIYNTTTAYSLYKGFVTSKRATPTITVNGTTTAYSNGAGFSGTLSSHNSHETSWTGKWVSTSMTAGYAIHVNSASQSKVLEMDSEL